MPFLLVMMFFMSYTQLIGNQHFSFSFFLFSYSFIYLNGCKKCNLWETKKVFGLGKDTVYMLLGWH